MPLYEYRCTSCGYTFEKIQSFSAEPEKVCPKCQGVLIRPVTAPALRFEGAGWYVNDYAGKGGAKSSEASAETAKDSKTESKPEVKTESKSSETSTAAATASAAGASSGSAVSSTPASSSSGS